MNPRLGSTLVEDEVIAKVQPREKDRPLLRKFGQSIEERICNSRKGYNRFGLEGCYTSEETLPVLDMSTIVPNDKHIKRALSSRANIHTAYTASEAQNSKGCDKGAHGLSSGSGCSIIRLTGVDAKSIQGMMNFADTFFEGVDDENCNRKINDVGVFRVDNNVHSGFDTNVNQEGKMQVLYGLLMLNDDSSDSEPTMLPMEVSELVGRKSISDGHRGMKTLFDVSKQIISAVLDMDKESTKKIVDDCTVASTTTTSSSGSDSAAKHSTNMDNLKDNISNSYQRLIRYLKPDQQDKSIEEIEEDDGSTPAFWPHVDSTLLTLIPLPEIPGLEVWAPSLQNSANPDMSKRGEWVQPLRPESDLNDPNEDEVYVVALAGEFLQLLSNGRVPSCIHRVMPTPGFAGGKNRHKKPRISAPLFLRPRRTEKAIFDIETDLSQKEGPNGVYYQEGLLQECDQMHIWEYMNIMSPDN